MVPAVLTINISFSLLKEKPICSVWLLNCKPSSIKAPKPEPEKFSLSPSSSLTLLSDEFVDNSICSSAVPACFSPPPLYL